MSILDILNDSIYIEGLKDVIHAHLNEEINASIVTTKNPIEDGRNIIDNSIIQPTTIKITVAYSSLPTILQAVRSGRGVFVDIKSVFQEYIKFLNTAEPTTIYTTAGTFENMLLVGISRNSNSQNYKDLLVDLSFEEVHFANVSSTTINASLLSARTTNPAKNKTSKVDAGQQTGKTSLLKSGINGLRGLF